mmetsp:Transcript_95953/g.248490  ORF Transcript_95953/g.248490 Transcript_95953/m.248490 type:complete len:536 (-) Transcript_95953:18-1625(-)
MSSATATARMERRIDPEDGIARTLEELRQACKDKYSEAEIMEYWQMSMVPASGENIASVAEDPFLTRVTGPGPQVHTVGPGTLAQQRSGGPPSATRMRGPGGAGSARTLARTEVDAQVDAQPRVGDVSVDPFLTSDRNRDVADLGADPFLTHGDQRAPGQVRSDYDPARSMSRRQQALQAAVMAKKHWTEYFFRLLGPGDTERKPQTRNIVIFGPWLTFLWVVLLWLVLRRYSATGTYVLTGLVALVGLACMFLWYLGRRGGPISLVSTGSLLIVAAIAGTAAGIYGWERFYRQYWWTQTGFTGGATTAITPALARADFAVLNFWDDTSGAPYNDTRVDPMMSAGYKDTSYYCVAPILDPRLASASNKRVNYWAVGVNCCQKYGHFTCDDSRNWDAAGGVVMLGGGYPCPSCNADKFRKAVTKAEAQFGLVSAPGAVFVRWVKEPSGVITSLLIEALAYLAICAFLGALGFAFLGWLTWYYGIGVRRLGDRSELDLGSARGKVIFDATPLVPMAPPQGAGDGSERAAAAAPPGER